MQKIIIVGGGISGLATHFWLNQISRQYNLEITLIEQEPSLGGKIKSPRINSNLCEYGPSCFMRNKYELNQLIQDLCADSELIAHNPNSAARFIYSQNKMHQAPITPLKLIFSGLISPWGKFRILLSLLKPNLNNPNPTLAEFITYYFGKEFLKKIFSPVIYGIHATNPNNLAAKTVFPMLFSVTQKSKFFISTLFKFKKNTPKLKLSGLSSFKNGMHELITQLSSQIPQSQIILNQSIHSIEYSSGKYSLNHGQFTSDILILTAPAYALAQALSPLDRNLSFLFSKLKYTPLIVVISVYAKDTIKIDLNGFGHLYTEDFELPILGSLWESSIFDNRTDPDNILIRTMLNVSKSPRLLNDTDAQLVDLATRSLKISLGIESRPCFNKVIRHKNAIPTYSIEHSQTIPAILDYAKGYPGLYFAGNLYAGIGINDCVKSALTIVNQIKLAPAKH